GRFGWLGLLLGRALAVALREDIEVGLRRRLHEREQLLANRRGRVELEAERRQVLRVRGEQLARQRAFVEARRQLVVGHARRDGAEYRRCSRLDDHAAEPRQHLRRRTGIGTLVEQLWRQVDAARDRVLDQLLEDLRRDRSLHTDPLDQVFDVLGERSRREQTR